MTSRTRLTKLPRSGDALTDWFFRQFVSVLRDENLIIQRMRRLHDPTDRARRAIRGIMDPFVHPSGQYVHILINPAKGLNRDRDEEVETLIHELAHLVMERTSERNILQLERTLAKTLSAAQKRILKSFLPRHIIKRYPRVVTQATIATS